ncbi:MAG: arylsulfatase, partial [Planctomycetales bacterium]|nr:arylsulfatase [Planctomycetales bacterium]
VIDLAPTILEAAGGEFSAVDGGPTPPGRSLLERFSSPIAKTDRSIWWLHEGNRALRQGRWKLVAAKDDPWELYDLVADRSETTNLAGQMPQRVEEMAAEWQRLTEAHFTTARQP